MGTAFDHWTGTVEIDGHEVARFRNMRGLEVMQLAKKAIVGQRTLERWEGKGVVNAEFETVRSVAKALAIDPIELLTLDFRQQIERRANSSVHQPQTPTADQGTSDSRCELPSAVGDFVGRNYEIERLTARFVDRGATGISALRGMGGVGKTTVALKVAWAVRDHFPDGQLFIDLLGVNDRPLTLAEILSRLIFSTLTEPINLPDTTDALLAYYRRHFSGRRLFLVLDNASDELQVRDLIRIEGPTFLLRQRA